MNTQKTAKIAAPLHRNATPQKPDSIITQKQLYIILIVLALLLSFPTSFLISKKIHRYNREKRKVTAGSFVSIKDLEKAKIKNKIIGHLPFDALSQPYFYLGKGKQSFAFQSEDGKYVIKLLKKPKADSKAKKIKKIANSFLLCASEIPEETSTIYLHASNQPIVIGSKKPSLESNGTKGNRALKPSVWLFTKKGDLLKVDIENYFFLLQKKAIPFKEQIVRQCYTGKTDEAKQSIASIITLLEKIASKGIEDCDGALIRNQNVGFVENKPILLDIGKLRKRGADKQHLIMKKNLKHMRPLKRWLELSFPDLLPFYKDQLDIQIKKSTAKTISNKNTQLLK